MIHRSIMPPNICKGNHTMTTKRKKTQFVIQNIRNSACVWEIACDLFENMISWMFRHWGHYSSSFLTRTNNTIPTFIGTNTIMIFIGLSILIIKICCQIKYLVNLSLGRVYVEVKLEISSICLDNSGKIFSSKAW